MANIKISQLPEFTGSTDNSWLILNNSGQTETFKITRENFLSGITTYTEITYSELYSLFTGETLTPGQFYLMTDFQTCYDQPDFDQNGNSIIGNNYKTGNTEQIVVLATSNNSFSPKAYSLEYPFDDISYDITFTQTERTNNPAKGRITERIDERGNRTDYDFRAVLFKRYDFYYSESFYDGLVSIDVNGNVTGTNTLFAQNFNVGDILGTYVGVFGAPTGCFVYHEILTIDSNTGMTVTGKTIYSVNDVPYSRGEVYNAAASFHQTNIPSNTIFDEYYTFQAPDVFNVRIGNYANLYNFQENSFLLSNNVFLSGSYVHINIGDDSFNNTFDDDMNSLYFQSRCYNNIIVNDFDRNFIRDAFNSNIIICDMSDNEIGNYFQYNMLGDNDTYDFDNNKIGSNFEGNFLTFSDDNFYNNTIGDYFYGNLIDGGFENNTIVGNFYGNRIASQFNQNRIGQNFYANNFYSSVNENEIGNNFYSNDFWYPFYDNTIGNDCYDNTIGNSNFGYDFYRNKIGNTFKANDIQNNFYGNTIGDEFMANQISNTFYYNVIGNGCFPNTFSGQTYDNKIGNGFMFNTFEGSFAYNTIGNDFRDNIVKDGFGFGGGQYKGNTIGNNFYNNNIGEYFYDNIIPDNFDNNTVGNYFQWNIVQSYVNGTDFGFYYGNITAFTYVATGTTATENTYIEVEGTATSGPGNDAFFDIVVSAGSVTSVTAFGQNNGRYFNINDTIVISGTSIGGTTPEDDITITITGISETPSVYGEYTCQIFRNSANNLRLSYYDSSDVLNITNITE